MPFSFDRLAKGHEPDSCKVNHHGLCFKFRSVHLFIPIACNLRGCVEFRHVLQTRTLEKMQLFNSFSRMGFHH